MTATKRTRGQLGLTMAHNIRLLRGTMSYAELSRKLTYLGRPIAPLGLRHIEAGKRAIYVDEIIPLAVALDTTPMALLLAGSDPRLWITK